MGGSVKVESELGVGTTFKIIFKVMCKVPQIKLSDKVQSQF
jgi:signal transduction histidine kinase